jgi:two-component system chemotaxis response regulator CheY
MPFGRAKSQPDPNAGFGSGVHRIGTAPRDTVLLVEPDPDTRRALTDALSSRFHVLDAPDAATGAELLGESETPRALVVSARLPAIDGLTFVRKLRGFRELAAVPVVFMTTPNDARQLAQAIGAGARACLEKPVDPGKLCARLLQIVGNRAADSRGR